MAGLDPGARGEHAVAIASVRRGLVAVVTLVAGLGLLVEIPHHRPGAADWDEAVLLLSLSEEGNLPTWLAASLLLSCAAALGWVAAGERRAGGGLRWHWLALALLFTYMSVDEAVGIHERLNDVVDLGGTAGGALTFSWIVPASLFVLVIAAAFLPLVRRLPAATRRRFLIAGAVYVGGALVMEVPLGVYLEARGSDTLGYVVIDWVEETLELTGAALFLLAVLRHAAAHHPALRLTDS